MNLRTLIVLVPLLFSAGASAVVEVHTFDNETQRQRYQHFIDELRCPKCQNQNLAGSNSPIAEDLRRELVRLLHEGKSDAEIIDFMVARYGDYVLYRPKLQSNTLVLWGGPILLAIIGLLTLVFILRRRHSGTAEPLANTALSEQEQERLARVLNNNSKGSN